MIAMTSVDAQNRFGELIDRAQREPVQVTRRGRTVAYVVSEHDMQDLTSVRQRRENAARWYAEYRRQLEALPVSAPEVVALTDSDVDSLVRELR